MFLLMQYLKYVIFNCNVASKIQHNINIKFIHFVISDKQPHQLSIAVMWCEKEAFKGFFFLSVFFFLSISHILKVILHKTTKTHLFVYLFIYLWTHFLLYDVIHSLRVLRRICCGICVLKD